MRNRVTYFLLVFIGLVTLGYNACTGPLRKDSGSSGTVFGNPMTEVSFSTFAVKGEKNVIEFCVSGMRLRSSDGEITTISDTFPKFLPISHLGNMFSTFLSPEVTYTKVEVDLRDQCGKGFSTRVENGNGVFSSTSDLTMKFAGNVHLASQGYRVDLIVQNFTDALSNINSNSGVASSILSEEGTLVAAKAGWRKISMENAPIGRSRHAAVWTGKQMIIWSGTANYQMLTSGSAFDPVGDSWSSISEAGVPEGRMDHLAVWTGKEMIVWGGRLGDGVAVNTGGRYNPTTDTWQPMTLISAPSPRRLAGHVWTGKYLFVWGGIDGMNGAINDGGRYDPETDEWLPVTMVNAPPNRDVYSIQWDGKRVIAWVGRHVKTYDPIQDVWGDLPDAPTQDAIYTVWTGTHILSWGNDYGNSGYNGSVFNVAANLWAPMTNTNAPADRATTAGVWTGKSLLIWGGATDSTKQYFTNDGHQYFYETDTWTTFISEGNPEPRYLATAVWTGSEMIVWGGSGGGEISYNDGGRYTPMH